MRTLAVALFLLLACAVAETFGQTTEGAIRGYVRDEQGGVLPGVTITATSPAVATPYVVVTDHEGYYRLLNLRPGTYTVTAELSGFAKFARENILVRAGLNLAVDIVMTIGALEETVTVAGEAPLLETSRAVQAVNVSAEMQQALPLAAHRHWSEFLRLAPGVVARDATVNNSATFYAHGAGIVSYSTLVEGTDITSVANPWWGYLALATDTMADVEIKTSGFDASTPLGMGSASNVVLKSGTNSFNGSVTFGLTPKQWIGTNVPGGTSETMSLAQPDVALGGPLQRDRWWFFASYRYRAGTFGVGRSADGIAAMKALVPAFEPFDRDFRAHIVFTKVTGQLRPGHQVSGFYNRDPTRSNSGGIFDIGSFGRSWIGGSAFAARLTSAWNNWLTSQVAFSWNDKTFGGDVRRTDLPARPVFRTAFLSGGRLVGSTQVATLDNQSSWSDAPHTKWTMTGDVTIYRSGWLGSHELRAGVFLQPRMRRETVTHYVNGGFVVENLVLRDPGNLAAGAVPFQRTIYDADSVTSVLGHLADNAVYVQDAWRPTRRLTINPGIRVDRVTRHDELFDVEIQSSYEVGPRVGVNCMLTADQRNSVRASFMRHHEAATVNHQSAGSNVIGRRDLYDLNLDGIFETVFVTPGSSRVFPDRVIDPAYHQPFVDEWAAGYRRQLPGQAVVDVGFIHRDYRHRTALVEQNAVYDGKVFKGYRNEALNEIYLLTNNRWNWPVYNALEIVGTKQTERFQVLGSYTRAWNHVAGTWQPNDPASFIQPSAFPNRRGMDSNDNRYTSFNNSLDAAQIDAGAFNGSSSIEWLEHVVRLSVVYRAPAGFILATNYALQAGRWSGPILTRLPAPDPQFGPPTVTLSNGRVVSNPLATPIRFAFPTRADGQYKLPGMHTLNLRVSRAFELGRDRRLMVDFDVLNVANTGRYQAFLTGANHLWSANYGKGREPQPPRAAQVGVRFVF